MFDRVIVKMEYTNYWQAEDFAEIHPSLPHVVSILVLEGRRCSSAIAEFSENTLLAASNISNIFN